jgi:hypothetical protein
LATNTLALLRAAAQDEADKENDPSISAAQWNRRVNDGYRSLWNLLRSLDREHFVAKVAATCASTSNNFLSTTLGANRLRALWFLDTPSDPDAYTPLRRWNIEERPTDRMYKVLGGTVYIYPATLAIGSYTMWVESAFVELANDASTIDTRLTEWAEYIYLYAAVGGKDKEESDTSILGMRLSRLEREIMSLANLDGGEPARIVDVSNRGIYRVPILPRP